MNRFRQITDEHIVMDGRRSDAGRILRGRATSLPSIASFGRAAIAVLVTIAALALAACAGQLKPVTLPPKSPVPSAPAPTPSPTASPSAQQQIVALIENFTAALVAAEKSQNAATARSMLEPYMEPDQIESWVYGMMTTWSDGESYYGEDVPHVLQVTVNGAAATADDCDDTSSAGLEYTATGKPVPGSQGTPTQNIFSELRLISGHWLVRTQTVLTKPCKA